MNPNPNPNPNSISNSKRGNLETHLQDLDLSLQPNPLFQIKSRHMGQVLFGLIELGGECLREGGRGPRTDLGFQVGCGVVGGGGG
jgi:hypothetical protein